MAAAADGGLLCRLMGTVSGLADHDDEIDFSLANFHNDDDGRTPFVVAQPAVEEAVSHLVGGESQPAARGTAARLIGGHLEETQVQLTPQHPRQPTAFTIEENESMCSKLDLDTPTTDTLLEALWPEVSGLGDEAATSWSDDDFDLLFPDLA